MMDWDDLRWVLAVARTGSLADAARALGVAHSTVYRRIAAFESEHGVRIFDRDQGAYALTDAGRELMVVAEGVEQRIAEIERRLAGRDVELSGEVRVTAPEALAEGLCALLPEFQACFPEIVVTLAAGPELLDLSRGEADVALRASAKPPESLVGRKIADLMFAVYGRRDRPAIDSWVIFDGSLAHTPQAKWEAAHVPSERVRARVASRSLFVAAVRAGTGIGVLPCGLGDAEARLVRIGEPITELTLPLWLLTHPDLRAVPRIRAFVDFVAARFGGQRRELEGAPG